MAKRRKRRSTRSKQQAEYPGWLWMIFGLAIGLSVAFAVYVNDREPGVQVATKQPEPASMIDNNSETADTQMPEEVAVEDRFDFYKMLPAFEMIIDSEEPEANEDVEPQAVDEPGLYLLQAGSFSTHTDADRRRADLVGGARRVLGLVIEEGGRPGADLDERQRFQGFVAHDTGRQFDTVYICLQQNGVAMLKGLFHGGFQHVLLLDNGHAHTGTSLCRFDHHRKPDPVLDVTGVNDISPA